MEESELRVIIADNNVQDRESKAKAMEDMGIHVLLSTGDGRKALDAIQKEKPDVVVMDMILPGIDGIGILEELNQMDKDTKPVIIIQTALRVTSFVEEAIHCGADYYMMKPVSNRMLLKRVTQMADGKNLSWKNEQYIDFTDRPQEILSLHQAQRRTENEWKDRGEPREQSREGLQGRIPEAESEKNDGKQKIRQIYSGDLEMDVTNILLEIGIPAHIKGYQYIREGIIMSFYDRNMLQYVTKFLYPSIAKKYGTTASSVERTIRHAIEVAWRRGSMDTLEKVFGNTVCAGKGKPTNSEFMALLTDKLRLEYRTKIVS